MTDAQPGRPPDGAHAARDLPPSPTPETSPRQRWRLYLSIPADDVPAGQPSGPGTWLARFEAADLPLAGSGRARGRVALAAPLPTGVAGEREIVDVTLYRRLTLREVRAALSATLPPSIELVDLHDVWLGAPSAAAIVVAADYRIEIAGGDVAWLDAACTALLAAATLPRARRREKKPGQYDLRPLLASLAAAAPAGGASARCEAVLRARLRHSMDGVGRPDEVLAALGDPPAPPARAALEVLSVVRERFVMEDDPDGAAAPA